MTCLFCDQDSGKVDVRDAYDHGSHHATLAPVETLAVPVDQVTQQKALLQG